MPFPFRTPATEEWTPPDYAVPVKASSDSEEWSPPSYATPVKKEEKKPSAFSRTIEALKPAKTIKPTGSLLPNFLKPSTEPISYDESLKRPEEKGLFSRAVEAASGFLKEHPKIREVGQRFLTGTSPEFEEEMKKRGVSEIQGPGVMSIPGVKQATDYLSQKVTGSEGNTRLAAGAVVQALGGLLEGGFDPRTAGIKGPEATLPIRRSREIPYRMEEPPLLEVPEITTKPNKPTTPTAEQATPKVAEAPAEVVDSPHGKVDRIGGLEIRSGGMELSSDAELEQFLDSSNAETRAMAAAEVKRRYAKPQTAVPAVEEKKPFVSPFEKKAEKPLEQTFGEFGGVGHPDEPEYANKVLKRAGKGEPGLAVEPVEGLDNVNHVVYRNKDGEPIAAAMVVKDQSGKTLVQDLAADKSKGLLTGRAMKALSGKLEELGATESSGTMSSDAENFLSKMKAKAKPAKEIESLSEWKPPEYAKPVETPKASEPHEQLVAGMSKINKQASRGALVHLGELRETLKDSFPTKEAFDSAVIDSMKQGRVQLHSHPWVTRLSDAEKEALVPNGRGGFFEGIGTLEEPKPVEINASGESAASQEAINRQASMKAKGEQYVVYDRAGNARPLIGPEAVDYQPRPGETFGIITPTRGFRVLESRGGKIPGRAGLAEFVSSEEGGMRWEGPVPGGGEVFEGPQGRVLNKLFNALEDAKENVGAQEVLNRQERARRFAAFSGVKEEGASGAAKSLGKLKGEFAKVQSEALGLKPQEADSLFTAVKQANITAGEKARGYTALFKLMNGEGTPVRSELKILDDVFGNGFADKVTELHGGLGLVGLKVSKLASTMKSMQNALSLAAPLRHGVGLVYKKEFYPAFKDMFKFFANKEFYNTSMKALEERPNYLLGRDSGLFLAKPGSLQSAEEEFLNSYVGALPGIRNVVGASQRAYTGFLNKLRADVFDSMTKQAEGLGAKMSVGAGDSIEATREARAIAKFINNATGRGDLGSLNKITNELNVMFWSPRMIASRVNMLANPKIYMDLPKGMRLEGLKSLLGIAALGTTIDTLAAYGGAKISSNILSTDFGKSRFGTKLIDPWGGFQQYVVFAARFLAGKTDSQHPQTRLDIGERFIANKLSPVASLARNILTAKPGSQGKEGPGTFTTQYGQPTSIQREVAKTFTPIFIQDLQTLAQSEPDWSENIGLTAAMAGASLTGMAQEYPEKQKGKLGFRKMKLKP